MPSCVAGHFNLGHDIARNTIKAILKERGIEPAPERRRHASWHTFIKSHLGAIAGADFFTVEVLGGFGLVRYWVMFVIDIGTRRVHIAGITDQPSEETWCSKQRTTQVVWFSDMLASSNQAHSRHDRAGKHLSQTGLVGSARKDTKSAHDKLRGS